MNEAEVAKRYEHDLKTSLNTLRQTKICTDVSVICGKREFPAHWLVLLSSQSKYFQKVCECDVNGSFTGTVILPAAVSEEAFEIILEFVYTTQFWRNANNDTDLLKKLVSSSYSIEVDQLFQHYLNELSEEYSKTSAKDLCSLVTEYEESALASKIVSHLSNKLCHLHLRNDFLTLQFDELKKILQYMDLKNLCIDQLVTVLFEWVSFDKQRHDDLEYLVDFIGVGHLYDRCLSYVQSDCVCDAIQYVIAAKHELTSLPISDSNKIFCFRKKQANGIMRAYDLDTNQWSPIKQLPFPLLDNAALVEYSGHVYFFGGYVWKTISIQDMLKVPSTLIYNYCLSTNKLVNTDDLLLPVAGGTAVILQGIIYIFGINDLTEDQHGYGSSVQCYNPVTRTSDVVASSNYLYTMGTAQLLPHKNRLYGISIADITPGGPMSGNVECYNPEIDQWTFIRDVPSMEHAYTLIWPVICGTRIFVPQCDTFAQYQFHIYDVTTNLWSVTNFIKSASGIQKMWSAKRFGKPVIFAEGSRKLNYIYNIEDSTWETVAKRYDVIQDYDATTIVSWKTTSSCKTSPDDIMFFDGLKLARKTLQTDIAVICEKKKLASHRTILSAMSPYFQTMFCSDWNENLTGTITLPTVSVSGMTAVFEFMYTGRLDSKLTNAEVLIEIFAASHLLQISYLPELCLKRLCCDLNMENLQEVYATAQLYDCLSLQSRLITFLVNVFLQQCEHSTFRKITAGQLKRVLQHPKICDTYLEIVIDQISEWVKVDPTNRRAHVAELMSCLDLNYMSNNLHKRRFDRWHPDIIAILNLQVFGQSYNNGMTIKTKFSIVKKRMLSVFQHLDCVTNSPYLVCFGRSNPCDVISSTIVQIYDINSGKSLPMKQLSVALPFGAAVVRFGRYVYFLGGKPEKSENATTKVYKYCPVTNTMWPVEGLRQAVVDAGAAVLDDSIYVTGGRQNSQQATRTVQRFIPATKDCDVVASTNKIHSFPIIFSLGDKLYLFSISDSPLEDDIKRSDKGLGQGILECYDSVVNQWTILAQIPKLYDWCTVGGPYLDKLYIVHGTDEIYTCNLLTGSLETTDICGVSVNTKTELSFKTVWKCGNEIFVISDIGKILQTYNVLSDEIDVQHTAIKELSWKNRNAVVMNILQIKT